MSQRQPQMPSQLPPQLDDGLTIPEPELGTPSFDQDDRNCNQPIEALRIVPELVVDHSDEKMPEPSHSPAIKTPTQTGGRGPADPTEAKCIALMGGHGGAGTTSLAIQMAYDIALSFQKDNQSVLRNSAVPDPKVCLIDLNFEAGACATYLDMPPSLEMSDLCGAPDRIDRSLTQALMATHDSGVALLSARNVLGGNDQVNGETVLGLLDAAAQMYDVIILDLPRLWRPWTQAAISAADHFAVVTELTIPALHMTRDLITSIEERLAMDQPAHVIINQVERRSFRNALRASDAAKVLHRDVAGTICTDGDTVREAINCGEPVGAVRAEARYVKDTRAILQSWSLLRSKTTGSTSLFAGRGGATERRRASR